MAYIIHRVPVARKFIYRVHWQENLIVAFIREATEREREGGGEEREQRRRSIRRFNKTKAAAWRVNLIDLFRVSTR